MCGKRRRAESVRELCGAFSECHAPRFASARLRLAVPVARFRAGRFICGGRSAPALYKANRPTLSFIGFGLASLAAFLARQGES
jgi:hypothetical protein